MSDCENKPSVNQAIIEGVANFETNVLKHVEVAEKVLLPSKEDIENEKILISFAGVASSLGSFDKNKLKPTVTQEKIILPDKEAIEYEKKNKVESEI